jgi:hypothetical protein
MRLSGTTASAPLGGLWGLSRRLAAAYGKYSSRGSNRRIWGELRLRGRRLKNAESDSVMRRNRREHITRYDNNSASARSIGASVRTRIGDGGGWWRLRPRWRLRRGGGKVARSPRR